MSAQVNGGVWKSDDYGRTWNPIFDDQPTQSIGAIAVAPSDPNIVYVASGEGLQRPDLSVGDGIYKSTDAGKTWTHLGLRDGQQIPALAIDPRDPNRLFAAVLGHPYGPNEERGIFRSTDGGATWQKVLYKDENTGGSDVEIDPSNPDVLYACLCGSAARSLGRRQRVQRSGGGFSNRPTAAAPGTSLPTACPTARAGLCRHRAQRSAPAVCQRWRVPGTASSVYRSDDAGENWSKPTTDSAARGEDRRRRSCRPQSRPEES